MAASLLTAAAPAGRLEVRVDGLRSVKGQVRLCLTADRRHFPDCKNDPAARKLSAPAGAAGPIVIDGLASGTYALAVIHDENGNARLDTMARIPREGFGFSGNPPIRFGPPKFEQVRFSVGEGAVRQQVRIRYIL